MRNAFLRTSLAAVLFLGIGLFYSGCKSSSDGTGPGPGPGTSQPPPVLQTPFGPIPTMGVSNPSGLMITALDDTMSIALAMFFDAGGQVVYAGDVTVNGNLLDTISVGGVYFYFGQNLTGVNFDGSSHNWTVAGGSGIPSFNTSVVSPVGVPTITYPTTGATVPRNAALTVTWSGGGTDPAYVVVTDQQDSVLYDVVQSGNSKTFTAAQMGGLSAGQGGVSVARLKFNTAAVGGRNYLAYSATIDVNDITLQ